MMWGLLREGQLLDGRGLILSSGWTFNVCHDGKVRAAQTDTCTGFVGAVVGRCYVGAHHAAQDSGGSRQEMPRAAARDLSLEPMLLP